MVVEIEFAHRCASKSGFIVHSFLNGDNPYATLFVGIKLWEKDDVTGIFPAAAIVWKRERNAPGADARNVTVLQALDFGTRKIHSNSKIAFAKNPANNLSQQGKPMLAHVPMDKWSRPDKFETPLQIPFRGQPCPAIMPNCSLILPKDCMFYRVRD